MMVKVGLVVAGLLLAGLAFKYFSAPREEPAKEQLVTIFKTDDFEIKYPDWPRVDQKSIDAMPNVKVGVSNGGCSFVIKATPVAPNTTLKSYIEKTIRESAAQYKLQINKQEIKDKIAYFDADLTMGNTVVRNVSYSFLTSKNISYGVAFVAEKASFDRVCQPFVKNTIESVKIN